MWLFVHFAQLPVAALLTIVLLALLWPMAGLAALIARIAVIVWAIFFSAFDSIAGIATGMLIEGGHADAATYLFEHSVVGGEASVLSALAHPVWAVVAIAGGLAVRRAGGPVVSQAAMFVSLPFALSHVGPLATMAMLSLALALATAPWQAIRPATTLEGSAQAATQRSKARRQ